MSYEINIKIRLIGPDIKTKYDRREAPQQLKSIG